MNTLTPLQPAPPLRRRSLATRASLRRKGAHGQGLVEYALVLMLIAITVVAVVTLIGLKTSNFYQRIDCGFDKAQAACQVSGPPN